MTKEEAIRRILNHIEVHQIGEYPHIKIGEALDMAISALKEKNDLYNAVNDGRVVILPCKVGDTVYEVKNNTDACRSCRYYSSWYGMDCFCDKQDIDAEYHYYPECAERPICEKQFMEVVEYKPNIDSIFRNRNDFGKTIFLSREEAEDALQRLEEV